MVMIDLIRMRYSLLFLWLIWCGVPDYCRAEETTNLLPTQTQPQPLDFDRFEVREWGALGSGCRGGKAGAGNISVRVFHDLSAPHRYHFLVQTEDYGLDSARPISPGLANFARECAIRFAIYPQAGFKVIDASAYTGFEIQKHKGVEVRLNSAFSVGAHVTQNWSTVIPKYGAGRWLKTVQQTSQAKDRKTMRSLGCAEPFLLGLDLSVATYRVDARKDVQVSMKDRQALIILEMGECNKERVAKATSPSKS
jgi:hypothetical protein